MIIHINRDLTSTQRLYPIIIIILSLVLPTYSQSLSAKFGSQTICQKLGYKNLAEGLQSLWNIATLRSIDRIFFLVFCPLLFIVQVFTVVVFIRYPSLLIKPGNIFFSLVIIQIGLNLHLFSSAIYHTIYPYSIYITAPTNYTSACEGLGVVNTFFETNHLFYLFIFPFYIIFLFKFSLKKKSDNFWRLLHGIAALVCAGLTCYFYFQQFIGLNIYGLCGLTTLFNQQKHLNWNIIMPSFQVFYSILFFCIGVFTYRYFRRHMPEQGQLKQRKIKNSQIILLFVTGFSIFQFIMSSTSLAMAIDCNNQDQLGVIVVLVTIINIVRLFQFSFTIFLILWNGRFRMKFKHTIKYLFVRKADRKMSQSFDMERNKEIQMQQIMFNQKLLKLKDKSNQIDLLFVSQIYTILSGVYAIFFEYFQQKNLYDCSNMKQIKPINFKQSITIQIDNQSLKNCEFQTRLLLKLKLLKCTLTLHSPKYFQALLKLDGLECVHESFRILENVKKIWNLADGQGGKSGQFFFFSSDRKYVLKTITIQQFLFLKKNLQHFYQYYKNNSKSVLAKIYGLFTIKGDQMQNTYRLILMKNITGCDQKQILRVYDLKGSKYDRQVAKQQMQPNQLQKITLKDIDFMKYEGKIRINAQKSNGLRQALRKDSQFLRELQLIDYSLLIVKVKWDEQTIVNANPNFWGEFQRIQHQQNKNEYYHIGIIDYLQLWDFNKRSQSWWKKLIGKKDISAVDPKTYCLRFINFVDEIVNASIKSFSFDSQIQDRILTMQEQRPISQKISAQEIKLFRLTREIEPQSYNQYSQQTEKEQSKQSPAFII